MQATWLQLLTMPTPFEEFYSVIDKPLRKTILVHQDLVKKTIKHKTQANFLQQCYVKKLVPPTFKIKHCHQMIFSEKSEKKWQNNIRTLELNNLKIACEEIKSLVKNFEKDVEKSKNSFFLRLCGEEQNIVDSELLVRYKRLYEIETNRLKNKLLYINTKYHHSTQPSVNPVNNNNPLVNENQRVNDNNKKKRRFIKRNRYRRKMRKLSKKPIENICINYSSHIITDAENSLLNKHLNYVPIPEKVNVNQLEYDMARFRRSCRWQEHFEGAELNLPDVVFPVKKHSLPKKAPSRTLSEFSYGIESDLLSFDRNLKKYNLTSEEKEALNGLIKKQKNGNIVIQKTDKGGAMAIMDRNDYISSVMTEHLESKIIKSDGSIVSAYRVLDPIMVGAHYRNIKDTAEKAEQDGIISNGMAKLMVPPEPCAARAYAMPKAHKEIQEGKTLPPVRLVISGCGSNTEMVSHFVDHYSKDIPTKLPSYIQDTPHLLRILNDLNAAGAQPEEAFPVTIDVVGLYPNIPIDEGIEAFTEYISDPEYRDQSMPWQFLITLLRFVLSFNSFTFNGLHYIQDFGTAIGTKCAPVYANIFMGRFEKFILEGWKGRPPDVWKRYIDDIISIWSGTEIELLKFLEFMNTIHTSIKFTSEYRTKSHKVKTQWKNNKLEVKREPLGDLKPRSIDFLDSTIWIDQLGKFQTDLFTKTSDRVTLLSPSSAHPSHICKNIPYSLGYRLLRLCSLPNIFIERLKELSLDLSSRGYNTKVIKSAFNRVKQVTREDAIKKVIKVKKGNKLSLILTFDPRLPNPTNIMKKHYNRAVKNPTFKTNFPSIPRICYRRSRNLGELLIRSKLYPLSSSPYELRDNQGFVKCSYNTHGCHLCKSNNNSKTHTSFNSGKVNQIKDQIKCSDTYLIYTIQCKKCKVEYVGKTTQSISNRFYQHYTDTLDKDNSKPVPEHFNSRNHSVRDMICIPFEKIRIKDETQLSNRETYWIVKKESVLKGLNRRV